MSNQKKAVECFISNPNAMEFHQTSNGFCWSKEAQAISHARELADKSVTAVTREELKNEIAAYKKENGIVEKPAKIIDEAAKKEAADEAAKVAAAKENAKVQDAINKERDNKAVASKPADATPGKQAVNKASKPAPAKNKK